MSNPFLSAVRLLRAGLSNTYYCSLSWRLKVQRFSIQYVASYQTVCELSLDLSHQSDSCTASRRQPRRQPTGVGTTANLIKDCLCRWNASTAQRSPADRRMSPHEWSRRTAAAAKSAADVCCPESECTALHRVRYVYLIERPVSSGAEQLTALHWLLTSMRHFGNYFDNNGLQIFHIAIISPLTAASKDVLHVIGHDCYKPRTDIIKSCAL